MPRCARWCVWMLRKSRPSKVSAPLPGLRMPMMVFMSVVLPAPLRPMRPVIEPGARSRDTSRRTCTAAMDTLRRWTLSMTARDIAAHILVGERGLRRRIGDDAAVVEGKYALREPAHDLHVVLHEEHCRALGADRVQHHLHDAELLLRRDAAGRLVPPQDARPCAHCGRDV